MQDGGEGSRAMNAYIVVCFVLAAAALVGYKVTNDERAELSDEYRALAQKVADIQGGLAPNIADYYRKEKNGLIFTVRKDVKDDTYKSLKAVAEELGINESASADDRLDMVNERPRLQFKEYYECACTVTLKNVTQSEWAAFLRKVMDPLAEKNLLDQYLVVESVDIKRKESNFKKLEIYSEVGGRYVDRSLWDATFRFVWFLSKEEYDAATN